MKGINEEWWQGVIASRSCPTESQPARGPGDLGQVVISLAGTVPVRVGWMGRVKGVNEGRITNTGRQDYSPSSSLPIWQMRRLRLPDM